MKKAVLLLLLVMGISAVSAQSQRHKSTVETFILQFNADDFESIYQSFSEKMKKTHSKKHYFDFLSKIRKEQGDLFHLELLHYKETPSGKSRGNYDGHFRNGVLDVQISVDGNNKIIGLYMKKKPLI